VSGAPALSVEVWSDVVCPWCFIGQRRLAKALDELRADADFALDVEVAYRPFQLDPGAPHSAEPVVDVYARKFGGPERAARLIAHVTEIAAGEGIELHLERAMRANTADAHRLLWWVLWQHGAELQAALNESLMTAYFCDGEYIADPAVLTARAVACGLDGRDVRRMLDEETGLEALAVGVERAGELGITGVPAYLIDRRWTIPGAQDPAVFVAAFRRLAAKRVTAP